MVVHQFLFYTKQFLRPRCFWCLFWWWKQQQTNVTTWKITKYLAIGDSDSFPLICWLFFSAGLFPLVVCLVQIKKTQKIILKTSPPTKLHPKKLRASAHLDAEPFPIAIVAIAFGVLDGKRGPKWVGKTFWKKIPNWDAKPFPVCSGKLPGYPPLGIPTSKKMVVILVDTAIGNGEHPKVLLFMIFQRYWNYHIYIYIYKGWFLLKT